MLDGNCFMNMQIGMGYLIIHSGTEHKEVPYVSMLAFYTTCFPDKVEYSAHVHCHSHCKPRVLSFLQTRTTECLQRKKLIVDSFEKIKHFETECMYYAFC